MVGSGSPAGAVYLFWIFFCYKQVAPLGQLRYWLCFAGNRTAKKVSIFQSFRVQSLGFVGRMANFWEKCGKIGLRVLLNPAQHFLSEPQIEADFSDFSEMAV